jgi:membrane protease YdiL (CAAX protease family)
MLTAAMDALSPRPPAGAARPRVRWGLPDVVMAWFAGVIVALITGSIVAGVSDVPSDRISDDVGVLLASVIGQAIGVVGSLWLIARYKGRGSLAADFGLVVRPPGNRWSVAVGWLLGGVGLQLLIIPFLQVLVEVHGKVESQEVVEQFEEARGVTLVLFAVLVVTVAPLAEELLFRGALLRGLMRRTTPVWAAFGSSIAFAAVHPLTSPSVGSVIAVPGLFVLGMVSAGLAIRTGTLSASILLHAGFNLLTAISVVATR